MELIIGKSLPVLYENNTNAWMTSEIFEKLLILLLG